MALLGIASFDNGNVIVQVDYNEVTGIVSDVVVTNNSNLSVLVAIKKSLERTKGREQLHGRGVHTIPIPLSWDVKVARSLTTDEDGRTILRSIGDDMVSWVQWPAV